MRLSVRSKRRRAKRHTLDPEEVVAMGAAVQASLLAAERADMLVPSVRV